MNRRGGREPSVTLGLRRPSRRILGPCVGTVQTPMDTIRINGAPPPDTSPQGACWMRSVSFAGLHRILSAVADNPQGLTVKEINELVLTKGLTLTPRNPRPAPTTLYHYRNTLLRLRVLIRAGRTLRANIDDPEVRELLRLPHPPNGDQSLHPDACDRFAGLVLRNEDCRSSFFDYFMPSHAVPISAADFRHDSLSVTWWHHRSSDGTTAVVIRNQTTGRTTQYSSRVSKTAIMYGLRYWARDQLHLIERILLSERGKHYHVPPVSIRSCRRIRHGNGPSVTLASNVRRMDHVLHP